MPLVSYDTLTRNVRIGELTTTRDILAFRDEQDLRVSLERIGFRRHRRFRRLESNAPDCCAPELIVIARGMVRLSFDVEMWRRGISTVPLPQNVRDEIEAGLRARLLELVAEGDRRGPPLLVLVAADA